MQIAIEMDDDDFEHLATNRMTWAAGPGGGDTWEGQVIGGRFETYGNGRDYDEMPSLHWKYAYWIENGYASVIMAKAFLVARGFECDVVWDLAEQGSWVLLTDYASPVLAKDAG